MSVKIIVGAQWGDEGKGKITDILSEKADYVIRYQGGNNAGHTVVIGNNTFKLHLIPSGILTSTCCCVIGNGVVLDPEVFFEELGNLQKQEISISPQNLKISGLTHIILPFHKKLDLQLENRREKDKIGTTGRGIGPCYSDKISRMGIRVLDLLSKSLLEQKIKNRNWPAVLQDPSINVASVIESYYEFGQRLKPFVCDTSLLINTAIEQNKNVILEGAQGAMLDVDHGTYPFVTSSSPIAGGACTGIGIGPNKVNSILGISKAYATRVGAGPFPTELFDETGEYLLKTGHEYGTTTSRPRRCGWLDLVALKYACRINGITEICITKLDILDGLDTIKVCTHYRHETELIHDFPHDQTILEKCEPIYESFPGWLTSISDIESFNNLPHNAQKYIDFLKAALNLRVSLISVGPKRKQTIVI